MSKYTYKGYKIEITGPVKELGQVVIKIHNLNGPPGNCTCTRKNYFSYLREIRGTSPHERQGEVKPATESLRRIIEEAIDKHVASSRHIQK